MLQRANRPNGQVIFTHNVAYVSFEIGKIQMYVAVVLITPISLCNVCVWACVRRRVCVCVCVCVRVCARILLIFLFEPLLMCTLRVAVLLNCRSMFITCAMFGLCLEPWGRLFIIIKEVTIHHFQK